MTAALDDRCAVPGGYEKHRGCSRRLQWDHAVRPSWILDHLAQQTQPHPAAADCDQLAIMEKPTVDRYRVFLAQVYCFEAPVEAACLATEGVDGRILRNHLKSGRLAADLEALGFAARDAVAIDVPHFDGPAESLGWLWVLHRNTLLHGILYRYLAGKLPDTIRGAGAYLSAFEGRAGALLRELGDAMERVARRASLVERMVTAAHEAFRTQRQWYTCRVLSPNRPLLPLTAARPRAA